MPDWHLKTPVAFFIYNRPHTAERVSSAGGSRSLHIVCVGGGPLKPDEIEPFKVSGCWDRLQQMVPDDNVLPVLYARAQAFVFPSLYEGFGLPILESFVTGCPVALSTTDCFKEVAEDAGTYFDPLDVDSIGDAIRRLLRDRACRDRVIRLGTLRASAFSWKETARRTADVYKAVV